MAKSGVPQIQSIGLPQTTAGSHSVHVQDVEACIDVSSTQSISALGHDSGFYQYTHYNSGDTIVCTRTKYCSRCIGQGIVTVVEPLSETRGYFSHNNGCTHHNVSGGINASTVNSATFRCSTCGATRVYLR